MEGRVATSDITDIAFEVLNVNRVEANNSCIETDVGFCEVCAKVVRVGVLRQVGFSFVQMFEERVDSLFIGLLSASKGSAEARTWRWCRIGEGHYVAKPDLYTPLLILSYVHAFVSSICFCRLWGKRSTC